MKSEDLFKAWNAFVGDRIDVLSQDDVQNLLDKSFCRQHGFLGRYQFPVLRLTSAVDSDRMADGRFYKRFIFREKYSICNDWYHSKTETNRVEFFKWFLDLCKSKGISDIPEILYKGIENDYDEDGESSVDTPKEEIEQQLVNDKIKEGPSNMKTIQKIYFGAPGTGKSHKIDYDLFVDEESGKHYGLKDSRFDGCVFRTTFHPDYDYAQFVGAYKPVVSEDGKNISYAFTPQVFANAYKHALDVNPKPVFLVIEEINRGNCAQIFGDIFQLLDRGDDKSSEYSIKADHDFAKWLKQEDLKLPSNLNILATMNTSDQSLFPMDSAFKRRFDWEYVPISFEGKSAAKFEIEVGDKKYKWKTFVENVNKKILDITESEDKQLGEYFIQPDKKANDSDTEKTVISEDRFKGKVMFYLWNEVCKDEHKHNSFFKTEKGYFTFQDLYKDDSWLAAFMEEITKDQSKD